MTMTGLDLWAAVDGYFGQTMLAPDPVLEQALADQQAAGLPCGETKVNRAKCFSCRGW